MSNKKITHYNLDNIEKEDADFNLIWGEKGNGKSYQIKHRRAVIKYRKTGKRFILLRRWKEEISTEKVEQYFADVDVVKIKKNQKPITLTYEGLDYGDTGLFKFRFIASGYNVGYDSSYFESNKELIEDGLILGLDKNIYGTLQMSGLHKVISSKNLFNISDDEKYRNEGAFSSKSFDVDVWRFVILRRN